MFASISLIPLYADPQLILGIGRCALMLQSTKVSHNAATIIEQYLPSNKFFPILKIIGLQSFCFSFEEERLHLVILLLRPLLIPHCSHSFDLLVCLVRQAFHYTPFDLNTQFKLIKELFWSNHYPQSYSNLCWSISAIFSFFKEQSTVSFMI